MNTNAKTIQIYLPGGDPRGIRVAEITTHIVQVIEVPRSQIKAFLEMPELLENSPVAVYFLFGATEDGQDQVYIGQTGNIRMRLNDHNAKKDFWQRALILVTTNRNFTQTHALFLEWYCLQEAAKAERYRCENGNAGSRPHTPAPLLPTAPPSSRLAKFCYPLWVIPSLKRLLRRTPAQPMNCTTARRSGPMPVGCTPKTALWC